jgi:hypothetical protein
VTSATTVGSTLVSGTVLPFFAQRPVPISFGHGCPGPAGVSSAARSVACAAVIGTVPDLHQLGLLASAVVAVAAGDHDLGTLDRAEDAADDNLDGVSVLHFQPLPPPRRIPARRALHHHAFNTHRRGKYLHPLTRILHVVADRRELHRRLPRRQRLKAATAGVQRCMRRSTAFTASRSKAMYDAGASLTNRRAFAPGGGQAALQLIERQPARAVQRDQLTVDDTARRQHPLRRRGDLGKRPVRSVPCRDHTRALSACRTTFAR